MKMRRLVFCTSFKRLSGNCVTENRVMSAHFQKLNEDNVGPGPTWTRDVVIMWLVSPIHPAEC